MSKLSQFNKRLKKAMDISSKEPYISMNKLAEYMEASPIRRREIVKILKKDYDSPKLFYHRVRKIIRTYFSSNYDDKILSKTIKSINKLKGTTDWDEKDYPNSILALKSLQKIALPSIVDYDVVSDTFKVKDIMMGGVKVGIKPALYLKNKHSGKVGAIKLHIIKTEKNRLKEESRLYAATLLKYGLISTGLDALEIDDNACISIDIFEEKYNVAPRAYKRRVHSLTAACEEILLRWNSI